MRIALARVALLVVYSATSLHGQTDQEKKAAELSQQMLKMHIAWRSKLSSPGASVRAKETERRGAIVKYSLYVSGLPTNELYTVMSWPVVQASPTPMMKGASIGKDGIVMCAGRTAEQCGDPAEKDDPIDFAFEPAKGEPFRLALISGDNRVAVVIVPDPISAKDRGCTLSVERLMPRFELAYFTGSGFPANSDASFDSESYGEKHPVKTKVDSEGNLQFALLPFVAGHQKGTMTVKGLGTSCSPSLKFDWGG